MFSISLLTITTVRSQKDSVRQRCICKWIPVLDALNVCLSFISGAVCQIPSEALSEYTQEVTRAIRKVAGDILIIG